MGQYYRTPFGFRNASTTFQWAVDIINFGVLWRIFLAYIDDVILFSSNEEEHFDYLDHTL